MRIALQWFGIILVATALDLFARFGGTFNLTRVLWVEAFLFPATGVGLFMLFRRGPRQSGYRRTIQILLIAAFFLAGLRSGLWVWGVSIGITNLLVLLAAILIWVGYRVHGSGEGRGAQSQDPV